MYSSTEIDYFPEILFLGDRDVGKTSLVHKLAYSVQGHYDPTTESKTMTSEFLQMNMSIGRSTQQFIAGVRLYDSHFTLFNSPSSLSRRRDIIVIVWSLSDSESFRGMKRYMDEMENLYGETDMIHAPPGIIICANKSDISHLEIEFNTYREEHKYFKIVRTRASRWSDTGIQELVDCIKELLSERYYNRQSILDRSIQLNQELLPLPGSESQRSCC